MGVDAPTLEVDPMRWLFACLLLVVGCKRSEPEPLRIAAASDLTEAFGALASRFEAEEKVRVVISFGSSGLLSKQISEGAPFDLFASANAKYVQDAVNAGACDAASVKTYARGRLAMMGNVSQLAELGDAGVHRIAIANPAHAPYGRAAQQALTRLGLWEQLKARVVFTENVRQAVQLADTGNAEVALVAWSNVIDRDGGVTLIDEALYEPIEQSLTVCKRGANSDAARRFVVFLESDEAKATMNRYGFR